MPRIRKITLRCRDPEAQRTFYCAVLGMERKGDGTVGYPGEGAALDFVSGEAGYRPAPVDLYWKITFAVPDLDLACAQLRHQGVSVGPPEQFGDIGYLAHLKDPEGFVIELIAHEFKGVPSGRAADRTLLGGGPVVNLLTLRAGSLEQVIGDCGALGMTLLATMPVEQYGFTLHFYASTQETPPSPDPLALENRPWVYQRPYTVLEIQHCPSLASPRRPTMGESGYVSAEVSGALPEGVGEAFGFKPTGGGKGAAGEPEPT